MLLNWSYIKSKVAQAVKQWTFNCLVECWRQCKRVCSAPRNCCLVKAMWHTSARDTTVLQSWSLVPQTTPFRSVCFASCLSQLLLTESYCSCLRKPLCFFIRSCRSIC